MYSCTRRCEQMRLSGFQRFGHPLSAVSKIGNHHAAACIFNDKDTPNMWDSNAENVRKTRRGKTLQLKSGPPLRSDGKSRRRRTQEFEVDDEEKWQTTGSRYEDDDVYSSYEEDEDENEDLLDWKIFLGVFGLGTMAFVGLPWMIDHSMTLTMVLAAVPLVQRVISFWSSAFQSSRGRRPTYRRRSRKRYQQRDNGSSSDDEYWSSRERYQEKQYRDDGNGSVSEDDTLRSWDYSRQNADNMNENESGWYELEEDRKLMQQRSKVSNARMHRFKSRRKLPLFWRLILTLFPILRSWGGFI